MYQCADFFAVENARNVLRVCKCKDDDRDVIIHGHGGGGAVHHLKTLLQHFAVGDIIIAHSGRILAGIGAVNAVNIFCKEDGVTVCFKCAEHSAGVGRNKGQAGAACEENGNTAYWQCARCEKYFADAKGETEIEEDSWIILKHGHDFGDWVDIETVSCDNSGLRERTCSICGLIEEQNLNPNGHDWEENYTINKEATCTEDGSKARRCKNCDAAEESQVIPALGHDYGDWVITKEATCTENGSQYEDCIRGDHRFEEEVAALGHDIIHHNAKAETCVAVGWDAYETCSRCDYTTYEEIKATGEHTWQHVVGKAGLLKNGSEYDQCTVCKIKKNVKTLTGYATYYVKSLKVAKASKAFTVKWAKQSTANQKKFNGYQIRYSLKSNMSGAKYVKAAKSSKSKKISKLKKKTKYYVQVRTYTVKNGKTFYSKWSAKKSVTDDEVRLYSWFHEDTISTGCQ